MIQHKIKRSISYREYERRHFQYIPLSQFSVVSEQPYLIDRTGRWRKSIDKNQCTLLKTRHFREAGDVKRRSWKIPLLLILISSSNLVGFKYHLLISVCKRIDTKELRFWCYPDRLAQWRNDYHKSEFIKDEEDLNMKYDGSRKTLSGKPSIPFGWNAVRMLEFDVNKSASSTPRWYLRVVFGSRIDFSLGIESWKTMKNWAWIYFWNSPWIPRQEN